MMPDLVGNDVGRGKVARGAEPLIELAEKREIEIDLPIGRAVEGTAGRRGAA